MSKKGLLSISTVEPQRAASSSDVAPFLSLTLPKENITLTPIFCFRQSRFFFFFSFFYALLSMCLWLCLCLDSVMVFTLRGHVYVRVCTCACLHATVWMYEWKKLTQKMILRKKVERREEGRKGERKGGRKGECKSLAERENSLGDISVLMTPLCRLGYCSRLSLPANTVFFSSHRDNITKREPIRE